MGTAEYVAARETILRHRTDWAAARAAFRWPDLDRFNWALDWFDVHASGNAAPALRVAGEDGTVEVRTYEAMARRSDRVANWLRGLGVRRGDRILLMLPNVVPLWETMLAAIKLGAVMIPATTLLAGDDLRDRLERGRVRHVVAMAGDAGKFADLPAGITRIAVGPGVPAGWHDFAAADGAPANFVPDGETRGSDPLLLYFTSGTTAKPKLVVHTQRSYAAGHFSTLHWLGVRPGDLHWNISSPGWGKHAWSSVFVPWIAGACVFALNQGRFAARGVLDALVAHGVTTLCAPPTVWRMLIQEDLARWPVALREVMSAGEPLNAEVIERVRDAWGLDIRDGYGQTETTATVGNPPGQPIKPGSMGRPLAGYDVVLLDAEDREADEGEIALRLAPPPAGLMAGYEGGTGPDGMGAFYRTGDVARRDGDGYLTYVGRADDVFKASDYRISPFELESVLIEHPLVAESAVVPSPDPLRLAVPKAYVALVGGQPLTAEAAASIFRHLRERLPPYKRIRRLEPFDLPKTISGKIRRVELRRREEARPQPVARLEGEFFEEDFPELRG
ncbi:MAG: AMP-binding protein [Rhodospirillales bacterium]|jgi:acetyl-CoA synthetase